MKNELSPCLLVEGLNGEHSLLFSDFDGYSDYIENRSGHGGGYSWESMVKATLEIFNRDLQSISYDSEAGMFVAVSNNKHELKIISQTIRDLMGSPELMDRAISFALDKGYFR